MTEHQSDQHSRRDFLHGAASVMATSAIAPTLTPDALDSIKTAFSKAKDRSPEEVAKDETLWTEVQKAYNYTSEVINMGSVVRGIAPKVVSDAVIDTYTRANEFRPGGNYDNVGERQETIRKRLAAHVGLSAEEIALTRNTTDGVTTVIAGLKLQAGDEILTTTEEHNPYYGILFQRAARDGLKVRCVSLPTAETPAELAEAIEDAITPRTKLIFVCHVYMSGQIFPVRRLCDVAHQRGIKALVDGALAFGHINIDVRALDCDFYAASLHKWGGGPPATGFFYAKREHVAALPPLYGYFDWRAQQAASDSKWREITLCNTALFTTPEQLDRFAAALKKALRNS